MIKRAELEKIELNGYSEDFKEYFNASLPATHVFDNSVEDYVARVHQSYISSGYDKVPYSLRMGTPHKYTYSNGYRVETFVGLGDEKSAEEKTGIIKKNIRKYIKAMDIKLNKLELLKYYKPVKYRYSNNNLTIWFEIKPKIEALIR